jgi:single-strand DNA-binding protein
MYQSITIIGNLGKDPEMRYTSDGKPVTSFSVAVRDGENTLWFRVSTWNKNAENAHAYLKKGSRVQCVGKMQEPRIFTGQDGTPRTALEMTAFSILFLSNKDENAESPARIHAAQTQEEDIPF